MHSQALKWYTIAKANSLSAWCVKLSSGSGSSSATSHKEKRKREEPGSQQALAGGCVRPEKKKTATRSKKKEAQAV